MNTRLLLPVLLLSSACDPAPESAATGRDLGRDFGAELDEISAENDTLRAELVALRADLSALAEAEHLLEPPGPPGDELSGVERAPRGVGVIFDSKTGCKIANFDNDIFFDGCNVYVLSGAGSTDSAVNGLGNLIVGYDEDDGGDTKTGSHNLIIGTSHTYTSYGGLIAGYDNALSGEYASVSGGAGNTASGDNASVSGGTFNQATGDYASVTGGNSNSASGSSSVISGGSSGVATHDFSVVVGGSGAASSAAYDVAGLGSGASVLADLEDYLSVDTSTDAVTFSGANVYIQSGGGSTDAAVNGLGNLVIGYDEDSGDDKTGSHNLVVGPEHTYSSYGGLIAGYDNALEAPHAAVSGGGLNTASGWYASIAGGWDNDSTGSASAVLGGYENAAGGDSTAIAGGWHNVATGDSTAVSGGAWNTASVDSSVVSGGYGGSAAHTYATVSGGALNATTFDYDLVPESGGSSETSALSDLEDYLSVDTSTGAITFSGANVYIQSGSGSTDAAVNGLGNLIIGYDEDGGGDDKTGSHNLVIGEYHTYSSYGGAVFGLDNAVTGGFASVSGGNNNTASGEGASVSGGAGNEASGELSSVSGGGINTASGDYASVSGGGLNTASEDYASVLGGASNTASGLYTAVLGGGNNTASHQSSVVLGGSVATTSTTYEIVGVEVSSGDSATLAELSATIADLEEYLSIDTSTDAVTFSGANVYIQSGSGSTDAAVNGLGNLIIGYDEDGGGDDKTGSHNLVVGPEHSYSGYSGAVFGLNNAVTGDYASVLGGTINTSAARASVVLGGSLTTASSDYEIAGVEVSSGDSATLAELSATLADLEGYLSVDTSTDAITFSGANVFIQSGEGSTDAAINGLGNLVIGYDESTGTEDKTGSHNLVIGSFHTYSSYGGLIAGRSNAITGIYASVSGGSSNTASGEYASVSGGAINTANGEYASVSGGAVNTASDIGASVSGGYNNHAAGETSSINGGSTNQTWGKHTAVSGGYNNTAFGVNSSISGGTKNFAGGESASLLGGYNNHTQHRWSTIYGGSGLTTGSLADYVP